jgi:hypothetical protein
MCAVAQCKWEPTLPAPDHEGAVSSKIYHMASANGCITSHTATRVPAGDATYLLLDGRSAVPPPPPVLSRPTDRKSTPHKCKARLRRAPRRRRGALINTEQEIDVPNRSQIVTCHERFAVFHNQPRTDTDGHVLSCSITHHTSDRCSTCEKIGTSDLPSRESRGASTALPLH